VLFCASLRLVIVLLDFFPVDSEQSRSRNTIPGKRQDAPQFEEMKMATKRHTKRKRFQYLCFLCVFVARDSVFFLVA